jgi:cytochrome c peroxidase
MRLRSLLISLTVAWCAAVIVSAQTPAGTPWVWNLPDGFPEPKVPADNPMTVEKVALGRALFYDTRLSINGKVACSTCHLPELAFTDGKAHPIGALGDAHPRSAMSLVNLVYTPVFTWANPNVRTLESQALLPMFGESPVEMGLAGREQILLRDLKAVAGYQAMFAKAFPGQADPFSLGNITAAIASFERSIISGNSPYDRFRYSGEENALSASAKRGESLFFDERTECFHCHGGFNMTETEDHVGKQFLEFEFFNTGLYNLDGKGKYPYPNEGVFSVTGDSEDMGRFKAPTLRNVAVTAPYMHDGSVPTLEAVLDHYTAGGRTIHAGADKGVGSTNPYKSGFVKGFTLTAAERRDLIAFLRSLTDTAFLKDPRYKAPAPLK